MIRIRVARNDFAKLAAQLPARAAAAVTETALEVEGGAKRRSRVDTGTMRRGWHTTPNGPTSATISNPTPYTIYNEFGTSKMPAQPMVTPAIEAARPGFLRRLAAIFR